MGFHAVALGFYFGHATKHQLLLKLVAKQIFLIKVDDSGKVESKEEMSFDRVEDYYDYRFDYPDYPEYSLEIHMHDDIFIPGKGRSVNVPYEDVRATDFWYLNNDKIKIGDPHICATMIYVGCVGDDLGGEKGPIIIDEDTLEDLFAWKRKLVRDGRLPSDVKLQMVGNCCS